MEPAAGQVIAGKFRLERCIGRGAMGSIWGARHLSLNAPVALKFMSPTLVHDPMALARFGREAEAAARIRSPHVVQVLDHGVDRGAPFIVMEWLDGEDLGARLRRVHRLSLAQAAALVTQATRALGAAHQAGVIHRDLKPSNVFLARVHDEETVKLLDFGVAKLASPMAGASTEATATGAMVGTPDYMSPEQVKGSKLLDHRADLWSLGVILYVALTGRKPFPGDSLGEVILRICTAPLTPPSALVPELPPTMDLFFARACAREPADRFQSAAELSAAFLAVVQGAGAYAAAPASARHPFPAGGLDALPPSSRGDASAPSAPGLASATSGARDPSARDLSTNGPILYVSPQSGGGSSAITSVLLALIIVLLVFALAREQLHQAFDLLKGLL